MSGLAREIVGLGARLAAVDITIARRVGDTEQLYGSVTSGDIADFLKEKGFDVEKMKKCFEGSEGKKLLAKSFAYSQKLGFGASPTWLVNGKFQFSGIDAETIKKNVCAHNKLPGCENDLSSATPVAQPGAAEPGCE